MQEMFKYVITNPYYRRFKVDTLKFSGFTQFAQWSPITVYNRNMY